MKHLNRFVICFLLFALLGVSLGIPAGTVSAAEGSYVCLPTCNTTDGRMFTIASDGLQTLAGQSIFVKIAVPQSMASFQIGIFDGDTSGAWDQGSKPLIYTLLADPSYSGVGTEQLGQWVGSIMADNTWSDLLINQNVRAQAPSGDYFYVLRVDLPNASTTEQVSSSFKVRSNSPLELATNQSFGYMVPLTSTTRNIIYPSYPALTPTTYDGTWDLYINVPVSQISFAIWDGDTDYGKYDCSVNDTDDADTPNDAIPAWAALGSAVPEGVGLGTGSCMDSTGKVITGPQGQTKVSGTPIDDNLSPLYRREPSVTYDVIDPNGNIYHNDNPAGNREWEQFLISPDSRVPADYHVNSPLPAGIYKIHITGLDLANLNAWHLTNDAICVHEDGTPCVPVLHPYKVGDTVWNDVNGNGVQDNDETGISGVAVTLLDAYGKPVPNGTTVTDANGWYSFGVEAGDYTVQIDSGNFDAGGVLAGNVSTTGGEKQTNSVTNVNVLTYDFGYRQLSSIGDRVWNDMNGNGIQDDGEAGLTGVSVKLLANDAATVLEAQTTAADGSYRFVDLAAGTYYVQFIAPAGYNFAVKNDVGSTIANDSNADVFTGKTDAIVLAPGIHETTIDAGLYQPSSLGDKVWNDANGNGIQDSGESGMAGVTVNLLSNDGSTVLDTRTTAMDGSYYFTDIIPGAYYVRFSGLPGYLFTVKNAAGSAIANDSNADPSTGKTDLITLAEGTVDNTIDAGLKLAQTVNFCGYIRTPGFWKNYSNHMSSTIFLSMLGKTQDFGYLTVNQGVAILSKNNGTTKMGIPALDGVDATFLKFLLTSEINAVWNGKDTAAGLDGLLSTGFYQGTESKTVNQVLHQAYLDRRNFSAAEDNYVRYLGAGGEGASINSCLIQP